MTDRDAFASPPSTSSPTRKPPLLSQQQQQQIWKQQQQVNTDFSSLPSSALLSQQPLQESEAAPTTYLIASNPEVLNQIIRNHSGLVINPGHYTTPASPLNTYTVDFAVPNGVRYRSNAGTLERHHQGSPLSRRASTSLPGSTHSTLTRGFKQGGNGSSPVRRRANSRNMVQHPSLSPYLGRFDGCGSFEAVSSARQQVTVSKIAHELDVVTSLALLAQRRFAVRFLSHPHC